MHVAFDGGDDDLALRFIVAELRFFFFDERHEMRHSLFHHPGRFDHLWQEYFALAEEVADNVHTIHQRTFNPESGVQMQNALLRYLRRSIGNAVYRA